MRILAVGLPALLCLLALWGEQPARLLLQGGRLIDGNGGPPLENAQILIEGDRIERVGVVGGFAVPAGATILQTAGKTILPGFVDAHFHIEDDPTLVPLFLARGITTARDPGAWMDYFAPVEAWKAKNGLAGPRLSLCGPHLDGPNPAYPEDSVVILSPEEARRWIRHQAALGADAVKVYFRLPLESIRAAAEEADLHNIPVTAHLEIINVVDAVDAGVDGIEHITSLGLALLPPVKAEQYRQRVLADNAARRLGRYQMWAAIDPYSAPAQELARFLAERQIVVDPTLAVFERRASEAGQDPVLARGFASMKSYVGVLHRAGVPIVVGSHSEVPFAERGMAYFRELELLVEAGLSPSQALVAATRGGAEFLRRSHLLGTVEPGKLADLLVLDGNPLEDISQAGRVSTLILGGRVLDPRAIAALAPPRR